LQKKTNINWQLKFSPLALKDLKKLDKTTNKIILAYLYEKLETNEDPRRFSKPLSGNLKDFWRYRVDDYRIICEIKDHQFQILAVHVAHRSKVYKNVHFLKSSA
jgi:mRNA interferase RelE/StbE